MREYILIDSGGQRKLEQLGPYAIIRPAFQAIWSPQCPQERWERADAIFSRERGGRWQGKQLPSKWEVDYANLTFQLSATDFGHLGFFPEQLSQWSWMASKIKEKKANILNLFAYSGGATLFLATVGCKVCHLDASKAIVEWAKKNAQLNRLERAPIRWIIDDVLAFLKREIKREHHYDGIILDPPSFGRGSKGQVFKMERDIQTLLLLSKKLLSRYPIFFLMTCHTPGFTPAVLENLFASLFSKKEGKIEAGELLVPSPSSFSLPSGTYVRWSLHG